MRVLCRDLPALLTFTPPSEALTLVMELNVTEPKPKRILRRPEVMSRVALTHSQIDYMEKHGRFPKRIKISVKAAGWIESEIDDFIDQRIAASRASSAAA